MLYFEKFSVTFLSKYFTYLSMCQDFTQKNSKLQPLHTTNTLSNTLTSYHPCSRGPFKNQQMLCFFSFSQPILKHVLCFSSLQSSFLFQICWEETSMLLLFQKVLLISIFQKFYWLLELHMANIRCTRPDHNYLGLSSHSLKTTVSSILSTCHWMSLL